MDVKDSKMRKIIFLDIDGVLNHTLMYQEKRQAERYNDEPKGAPDGSYDLCTNRIELLNKLIKDTGALVVISSSWRQGRTVKELSDVLEYKGFKGNIIGKTPSLRFESNVKDYSYSVPRGCEIKAWIELNKGFLGCKVSKLKYIILDDDSDMLYWQRENYFRVDRYSGLTPSLIYRATHFLNK